MTFNFEENDKIICRKQILNLYVYPQKVKNNQLNLSHGPYVVRRQDPVGSNDHRSLAGRSAPKTAQSIINIPDDPFFRP